MPFLQLDFKLRRLKTPHQRQKARNYKNYDPELFRADLHRVPWDITELESDTDNAWNSFEDLFMTAADSHAPVYNRLRVRSFRGSHLL